MSSFAMQNYCSDGLDQMFECTGIRNIINLKRDLRVPPGNRLEALKGKRQGQWSVRINDQWRICFRFEAGNAFDVEIVDYH